MALQANQIVTLACQVAKVPAFTAQAGQLLNMILSDLSQTYDLEVARGLYLFNFNSATGTGSGPYTLPSDWLRARNKDVFYTIDGVVYPMIKVEIEEYDWFVQQAGLEAYPSYYTTDMSLSPPVMFVWVPPSGSFPVTCRYYKQKADIVDPETSTEVPWFPSQDYLITRLAGELMKICNDDRCGDFLGDGKGGQGLPQGAQYMLDRYLKKQGDRNDVVSRVSLDRRMFGRNARLAGLPNTKTIGW